MRKIILASRSKPRRALLKQVGLKFSVAPSSARETHDASLGCRKVVIDNAVRKAKDVARRYKSGVVISADTVVFIGKKIVGKPKSLKDAFRTLKALSKKPQWVHTGIAVIDIDNGKIWTDHEKTKVYMSKLSDDEIWNYFKRVSPLDKAGSFDVQGFGSIFIDRIEGCFYNVVGLPLAKLARLLNKCGIQI